MRVSLGDTVKFSYSAPDIHDKEPQIYFLAKVGNKIHGLNQHYQTPQEKIYYFLTLKSIYYNKIKTGLMSPQVFYDRYIKGHLVTDSYRTYRTDRASAMTMVPLPVFTLTGKVDIRAPEPGKYTTFKKGDKVRFVSMKRGKLSWSNGTILGRKIPGADYLVQRDDGKVVNRHPVDLKPI